MFLTLVMVTNDLTVIALIFLTLNSLFFILGRNKLTQCCLTFKYYATCAVSSSLTFLTVLGDSFFSPLLILLLHNSAICLRLIVGY